jgi:hypothetical protein
MNTDSRIESRIESPVEPRIQTPAGVLAPERHADRVVAEMLRFIARKHASVVTDIVIALKGMRAGNPVAQQRMVERIRRAAGPTIIKIHLHPGKRGKYVIEITDWSAYDPSRNTDILPGDPIPEKPQLAIALTFLYGAGCGRLRAQSHYCLHLTHHALSRLTQRCGARTPDDLIAAAKAIWAALMSFALALAEGGVDRLPVEFRVPVDLPNGMGRAVAVVGDHDKGGLLVLTIINEAAP